MKVDSKQIMPFIETLKSLLNDLSNSFPECDEREQVIDCFDYTHEQIKSVLNEFQIKNLTPVNKELKNHLPGFVQSRDRLLDEEHGAEHVQSDYELKVHFMAQQYFIIKRKIANDGVDHLFTRDKISFHIYHYLIYTDDDMNIYLKNKYGAYLHDVIDTIIDEIIEARRKAPQMKLDLEIKPAEEKSNKLIDNL